MKLTTNDFWCAERTKLVVLITLLLSAFFLGGSARYDTLSLILLRPISVLASAYALYVFLIGRNRSLTKPLLCLLLLFTWVLIQLVPLPAFIWQNLPGREIVTQIDTLRGAPETWRPLTLSPSRTLNSLMSLFVPLGVLLLMMMITDKHVGSMLLVLAGLGFASALIAMAQVLGPVDGPLYFYKITNNGLPVGLFANRNHHAVFLASLVPLVAYIMIFDERLKIKSTPRFTILFVVLLFMVVLTFMTGSRAGSLLIAAAIIVLLLFAAQRLRNRAVPRKATGRGRSLAALQRYAIPAAMMIAILMVGLTLQLSDSEAIARLNENDTNAEVRFKTLPYVAEMAWAHLPFGSGFGSFEFVYKIIEPDELLTPSYFNQAHNDLLQVIIEGGIPAGVILFTFVWWLAKLAISTISKAWHIQDRAPKPEKVWQVAAALTAITIVLLGSIADYPIRTPLIMSYIALLTGVATRNRHS